jgi:hypothetical protein
MKNIAENSPARKLLAVEPRSAIGVKFRYSLYDN